LFTTTAQSAATIEGAEQLIGGGCVILICYDGSDDAKAAIENASVLFSGESAVVLTVWESFVELFTRTPGGHRGHVPADEKELDHASRERAEQEAQAGATLARDLGIDAAATVRARSGTVADTILAEADKLEPDAIVLGSRGLGSVASLLIGSVSHAVIQSADRTVVTTPSSK
jgi:nucleotide-binding universal stress UspA family protein